MRSVLGLLVVAVIALLTYKYYFSTMNAAGAGAATPMQTIDMVGVKNDLLSIAQAERAYQAEHSSYASLDELVSSGALTMKKTGRDGYTYDAQPSDSTFRVIAHCPAATSPGCTSFAIDQTMQIQPTQ
jgi:3-hydroxyacyl-CoA dehydrogenase